MKNWVHFNDVTFYRDHGDDVVWVDYSGDLPLPSPGSGVIPERLAALLIEMGVDGEITVIHHQGGSIPVIKKLIENLSYLAERLEATYPDDQPDEQCVEYGDWGRCKAPHTHPDNEHQFPDRQEYERTSGLLQVGP